MMGRDMEDGDLACSQGSGLEQYLEELDHVP